MSNPFITVSNATPYWPRYERLQTGDLVMHASRKYASLDIYPLSPAEWVCQRPDLLTQLGSATQLDERLQEVEAQLPLLEQLLAQGQDIRLDRSSWPKSIKDTRD